MARAVRVAYAETMNWRWKIETLLGALKASEGAPGCLQRRNF